LNETVENADTVEIKLQQHCGSWDKTGESNDAVRMKLLR